jgi:4-hydroxythreonine-4-phosphate dehydrogenase
VEAVRVGAELVQSGQADALVTLPLSKAAAHLAGFMIPGHTEFLKEISGAMITRMAFVSPSLSVVLHTVHQSLRSVVEEITTEAVAETLSFAADRFIQLTGKNDLRVALCALNPHAGESGAFGEEETILQDAVIQAEASFLDFNLTGTSTPYSHVASPFQPGPLPEGWAIFPAKPNAFQMLGGQRDIEVVSKGLPVEPMPSKPAPRFFGPLPSDTLFMRASKGEYDLVVALYHDQGLIPIKVLEPSRAVNLTLGLPFIRTSPDHGTAFEIAGRWSADPTNFLEATALAVRLAGRAKHQPWRAEVDGM